MKQWFKNKKAEGYLLHRAKRIQLQLPKQIRHFYLNKD